ncbi:MAG TPA: tetratricopeptide repeat protein [Bryobacteraceae bacterium]|jgi:tetratricopeptide (TPR) repeat protein|nr:tetratricopeptide repeat protein [Bryobacteraceae bacterium]
MKPALSLLFCGLLLFAATDPPPVLFDRAARALAAGDYAAAEHGFEQVLQQEPNNVSAIGNLGILYARTDRLGKAIALYRRALRLSPNDEPILLNLGIAYLKQDRHAQALPYFARVAQMDPANLQARQLLAVCRIYTGESAAAVQELTALRAANPSDRQTLFLLGFAYLKAGDQKSAQEVFHQMFDIAGPAETEFLLGRASYEAALFPQAEESFLQVQKTNPSYPGLHLALGKLYISERRTDDAVRELKAALGENPNDEDANYFLGSLLVRENQFEAGIPYLERARQLKPDSWAVYLYLGRADLHLNRYDSAIRNLKTAAELNPDDADTQYQFGRALQAGGQKQAASAAFAKARALKAGALEETVIPGTR